MTTLLLEQAEAHLGAREIGLALELYAGIAREGGAEPDRIDGGRWMCHMLRGEYEMAWRCSDAIRDRGAEDAHRFWTGEAIGGKRLMLRCLHGDGDTVMYLRWLPELRRRCSEVIVQACPEMLPLVEAMVPGNGTHLGFAKVGHAHGVEACEGEDVVLGGAPVRVVG